MKELLRDIREALFDAPSEVKSAFNDIVEYFDGKGKGKNSVKKNPCEEARSYRDPDFKSVLKRFDFESDKDCKKFISLYKRIFNAIKKNSKGSPEFKDPYNPWAKKLVNQIIGRYPDFNVEDIDYLNVDFSHFGGRGNKFELIAKSTPENESKYGYNLVIADLNDRY